MTEVLKPLLDVCIQLAAAMVLALGMVAIGRLTTWLRLANDARVRGYLQEALEHAVDYAEAQTRLRAGTQPGAADDGLAMLATAAAYVRARVPDALAHLKIDPAGLAAILAARIGVAHELPVAPPAPPAVLPYAGPRIGLVLLLGLGLAQCPLVTAA